MPRWGAVGRLLAGLTGAMLLAACVVRVEPPAPPKTVPAGRALPSQEEVRQALARVRPAKSLQGAFKLKLERGEKTTRLSGGLAAGESLGVRVDLLTILGPPVAYGLLQESRAALYLTLGDNAFYQTNQPQPVLDAFTGGGLKVSELVRMILGGLPECTVSVAPTWRQADDRFVQACVRTGGGRLALILEPQGLRVVGAEGKNAGQAFVVRLKEPQTIDGVVVPFLWELEGGDQTLTLQFEEVVVNPPLDASVFALEPPPGVSVQPLEGLMRGSGEGR